MKKGIVLAAVCILMLLMGCVDKRMAFQDIEEQQDKAVVYVYRPDSFVNSAETMDVDLNGADIGYLTRGGYRYALVEPGDATVILRKNVIPFNEYGSITVRDLKAGKSYYIKADPVPFGGFDMMLMDEATGRREASGTGLYVSE